MLTVFAAGSWNWSSSSVTTALTSASSMRPTSWLRRPYGSRSTAILVHKGIDHYAVPVSGLQYLEATPTHLVLATRPVKLVSAYLAPTRALI
jgi:hypothetical protein